MRVLLRVVLCGLLAAALGFAALPAGASVEAKKQPSSTANACKLAVKYGQPTADIPGGEAVVQQVYLAGSIKDVKAFKGKVPELLKPNEKALANAISADGDTDELTTALASIILTCNNTGVIKLTPEQLVEAQESTGTLTP